MPVTAPTEAQAVSAEEQRVDSRVLSTSPLQHKSVMKLPIHISQEPTPPRSGTSPPLSAGRITTSANVKLHRQQGPKTVPSNSSGKPTATSAQPRTSDLSSPTVALRPPRLSLKPRRPVNEDDVFTSVASSPQELPSVPVGQTVSSKARRARRPPKYIGGPYVSTYTDAEGSPMLAPSGHRISGVGSDHSSDESPWPPRRPKAKKVQSDARRPQEFKAPHNQQRQRVAVATNSNVSSTISKARGPAHSVNAPGPGHRATLKSNTMRQQHVNAVASSSKQQLSANPTSGKVTKSLSPPRRRSVPNSVPGTFKIPSLPGAQTVRVSSTWSVAPC